MTETFQAFLPLLKPSRRGVLAIGAVALLLAPTGCTSTEKSAPSSGGNDAANAGKVAVSYAKALFDGNVSGASKLVQPDNQQAFRLIAPALAAASAHANGLAVGKTVITKDRGVTTLVGDLCRKASPKTASPKTASPETAPSGAASPGTSAGKDDCVSNHDPNSDNPIFKVATARQPDGKWLVILSLGGQLPPSGSAGSGPTPAAPPSP